MRRLLVLVRKFQCHHWYRKCPMSTFDPTSYSSHLEEIESRLGMRDPIESQRHYLFPDLGDKKLVEAGSVEEVFDLYSTLDSKDYRQTCQAIATLFHLQKSFRNVLDISINNLYIQYSALNKFNKALHDETPFNQLIQNFQVILPEVPLHISSFTFLCLSRLGISLSTPLMNEMLISFQKAFKDIDPESLSYISVGIRYTVNRDMHFEVRPRIWWVLYLRDALPSLRSSLSAASTPDELNKLTITVFSLRTAMSPELLQLYLDKVREILLESPQEIDEELAHILVKIASVVENIFSQEDNDLLLRHGDLIPKIILRLQNRLHLLRWVRLVRLSGLLHRINEGSSVIREELLLALRSIYKNEVISNGSYSKLKVMTEILRLEKRSLPFNEWISLTDMILNKNRGPDFYFHVNDILQMSSNIQFMNEYEEGRFVEVLRAACQSENESDMLRFFGNYQVNKRHLPRSLRLSPELKALEKEVIEDLKDSLSDTYIVANFMSKFSYLLAYIDQSNDLSSEHLQKFKNMSHQLNPQNLFKISFSYGSLLKKRIKSPNLKALEAIVQDRVSLISSQSLSGREALIFLKALRRLHLNIRSEETRANIYQLVEGLLKAYPPSVELIHSVGEFLLHQNPQSVDITPFFNRETLEAWLEFVVENQEHSESYDCIRCILSLAHRTNMDISLNEDFVSLVHKCLYRNIAFQSSGPIIQSALSLITYRSLSEELIQMIFSVEFMEKIDAEIAKASRQPFNSDNLRILLMRLNRAAHLLHPEFQIPWFHQKFCQENNTELSEKIQKQQNGLRRSASFENSVFDALTHIFGDPRYIGFGVFSPYFHYIPFEICLENGVPLESYKGLTFTAIRHSNQTASNIQKYAFYPRYADSQLGEFELMTRELQTLGYRVIPIEEKDWNSMKMSCDDSKASHIKQLMGI